MIDIRDVEEGRRLREGLADFCRVFGGNAVEQQSLLNFLRVLAAEATR